MSHRLARRNACRPPVIAAALALGLLLAGASVAEDRKAPSLDPDVLAQEIDRLKPLLASQPNNAALTQQLALVYNARGVSLADHQQWDVSLEQFRQALTLQPQNATIERNLVQALIGSAYHLYDARKTAQAKRLLTEALRYPPTYEGLMLAGQLAYDDQQLKDAERYWTQALRLKPDGADAQSRLAQLARERPIEDQFGKISQQFFDIRYNANLEDAGTLRGALLDARRVAGQAFHYFPAHKIVVLVYTEEQFRQLHRDMPEWLGGQYDGKIRIPIRSQDPQAFRRILWHEYTHALVHDLSLNRCPTWLNEGLAEYEGSTQQTLPLEPLRAAATASPKRLLDLTALSAAFNPQASAEQASLAYAQAYSLIGYVVERYGLWRLTRVLKRLGAGETFDAAWKAELHVTPQTVYQRWLAAVPTLLDHP